MIKYMHVITISKVFVVGNSQGTIMSLAAFTRSDIAGMVEERQSGVVSSFQLSKKKKNQNVSNSRVLVLGGTGRVGGSTAIALSKLSLELQILVAGRNREKGARLV